MGIKNNAIQGLLEYIDLNIKVREAEEGSE